MKKIIFFLVLFSAFPLFSDKIYSVLSRGVVLDRSTGLFWTRCPLSTDNKPIYNFNCVGEKKYFSITEAIAVCSSLVYEGRSDWRLPTVRELQSIVFYHHKPTLLSDYSQVYEKAFPNAITSDELNSDYDSFWGYCFYEVCRQHYWTSTVFQGQTAAGLNLYWVINFYTGVLQWDIDFYKDLGGTIYYDQPKLKSVRCVAGP